MDQNLNNKIILVLVPVLLSLIVFYQLPQHGFANIDDQWMLLDEFLVQAKFSWDTLSAIFTRINSLQYSPLNTLYYLCLYQINGYDPYFFHLGSLFIHLINGFILFNLLKVLFISFSIEKDSIYAYVVVLLWLVHPFNVESIAWVSASKIPLFSSFFLLSFYFFIKAYKRYGDFRINYILSIICFALSFLSKEQSITLPLIIAFYILVQQLKGRTVNIKKLGIVLVPYILLSCLFVYITLYSLNYEGASHPFDRYSLEKRLFFVSYSLGFYILNSYLPIDLHYHYNFPVRPHEQIPVTLYVVLVSLVFTLVLLHSALRRTKEYYLYLFLSLFFVGNLALCIHIISLPRASIVADRYMYLPLISTISIGVVYFGKRWENATSKYQIRTLLLTMVCILIALMLYSHNLVLDWNSRQILGYED